jgi:hypothetical protein
MPKYAGVRAPYVILIPEEARNVPNGAVFLDKANSDMASVKTVTGVVVPVGSTGVDTLMTKQMQAGEAFPAGAPLSKRPDGKVIVATSEGVQAQQLCGHALEEATADGDLINVLTIGANVVGALEGLNLVPGAEVFIDESGGYTGNPGLFTGNNDSVIRAGIADCPAGEASSVATDLIVMTDILLRPVMP